MLDKLEIVNTVCVEYTLAIIEMSRLLVVGVSFEFGNMGKKSSNSTLKTLEISKIFSKRSVWHLTSLSGPSGFKVHVERLVIPSVSVVIMTVNM